MIPPEVTEIILSHLSPKSLLNAATVCQVWYLPVMYSLYRSVDLYSTHQHQRFMDGLQANNVRVADDKMKTGHLVRKLTLHTNNIMMDESEINTLKNLCPLVTSFDYAAGVRLTDEHLCYFTPRWKNLKRLPPWHEDESRNWIPQLGGQLTEIGCYMEEFAVLSSLISPSPLFPCLVDLKIKLHYIGPCLDIEWMEMINDQCPLLKSLHMEFVDVDFGDNNNNVWDWKPAENLRVLAWTIDKYIDPIWYTYLAQKYPKLTELCLTFNGPEDHNLDSTGILTLHKTSFFNMVKSYQHLITFSVTSNLYGVGTARFYPWRELGTWLGTEEAKHIKCLRWEMGDCDSWFDYNDNDSDITNPFDQQVNDDQRYPLGNIKQLDHLVMDFIGALPEQMSGLCFGTLVLENMSTLELKYNREEEPYHYLDAELILDACPNITVLRLSNVELAYMERTTTHQRQLRPRLYHFELTDCRFHPNDYMTHFVNRCPNLSILNLRCCQIYERSWDRGVYSFTIDAPHHSFSLVTAHMIQSMNGYGLTGFNVNQTSQAMGKTLAYQLAKLYWTVPPFVIDLTCSHVDTVTFE